MPPVARWAASRLACVVLPPPSGPSIVMNAPRPARTSARDIGASVADGRSRRAGPNGGLDPASLIRRGALRVPSAHGTPSPMGRAAHPGRRADGRAGRRLACDRRWRTRSAISRSTTTPDIRVEVEPRDRLTSSSTRPRSRRSRRGRTSTSIADGSVSDDGDRCRTRRRLPGADERAEPDRWRVDQR